MAERLDADASPEKRLFVSLITRDIPLVAAFLDLIDNSVNAAIEPFSAQLKTAPDYLSVLHDEEITPKVLISLDISDARVVIRDDATGISAKVAEHHVFKFGRAEGEAHEHDRLSVYGIGLKRAIFKLGNLITIKSDHVAGGFDMKLNVASWLKVDKGPWVFPITIRSPADPSKCGTSIAVEGLYDEVRRRISDGVFVGQLRDAIARTYAFYLTKFVVIQVNGSAVEPISIDIGENHASEEFTTDGVSCAITAGIGIPQGGTFRDRSSGWFVFCNGRAVVSADKTQLTGWGIGATGLPLFQPKHRPFIGTVFFVSEDAEKLPWTTTKSDINEDSSIWQEAKRQMSAIGRTVISFLDSRYNDEGTEIASPDLQIAAGTKTNVIMAAVATRRSFEAPKTPPPENVKIQYSAKVADVKRIETYLRRPGMGGSEVGRHTFHYFLRNEVGEK